MKIAVLSDFHFGFASGTELENDSFEAADEAMRKSLDADLIIIPGDIFDSRAPKTNVWARAIQILVKPMLAKKSTVNLLETTKDLKEISRRSLQGIPIVAIHGNHERRSRGDVNAVEALEHAGLLIALHGESIVFEKEGRKVAIHGMGNVPERFAFSSLEQWSPKPIEGCFNILLLHQSIDPYVFSPLDPPSISTSNLPKGFDMIINGHIHTKVQDLAHGKPFLIPGSTVVTQLEKSEAENEKGFFEIQLNGESWITFVPLQENRKFFYREIKINESAREQIEKEISSILDKDYQKKPLLKIRIVGKESDLVEQDLKDLERKFSEKAFIRFSKELESPEVVRKIEFLRNLREQKLSVEEVGLTVLRKNMEELHFETVFDFEKLFSLLSEGEDETALSILIGEQRTLGD